MSADHGNTPAAWVGVSIVLVGFVVGGIGLVIESMPTFFTGLVIGPLGAVVGYVLGRTSAGNTPLKPDSR